MKKILLVVTLLSSLSAFASECSVEKIEQVIVDQYNLRTHEYNQIEIGEEVKNFDDVQISFLSSLEWHLAQNNCPQFEGSQRSLSLKNLFEKEIEVDAIDNSGNLVRENRKLTTSEIAEAILNN